MARSMARAACIPPLKKPRVGHPQFCFGRGERRRLGHPPLSLVLTAYGGVGALGDLTAGSTEILAAVFGSDASVSQVQGNADAVAAVTTVSGAITLATTGGNVEQVSHAAALEDIVLSAGVARFTGEDSSLGDALGLADDANDLSSSTNEPKQ